MLYWTDLHLAHDVPDETIAHAVAAAFGLPDDAVAVAPQGTDEGMDAWQQHYIQILVQRVPRDDDSRDQFPIELSVTLKAHAVDRPVQLVERIARHLGVPLMTDVGAPSYPDTRWRLVAPDGWSEVVDVDDDALDDGRMTLTPTAQQFLDAHTAPTQATHLRHVSY